MESTYESAAALVRHAAGPLTDHLGAYVAWLIEQQHAASVVYIKARHALASDRWLAKRRVALADLSEVNIERYQSRRRRGHRAIRAETRHRETCEVTSTAAILAWSRSVRSRPARVHARRRSRCQLWALPSASARAGHNDDQTLQNRRMVELRARLCTLSKRHRPADSDSPCGVAAVPAQARTTVPVL